MAWFRRRLRFWAAVWLILQADFVIAAVPRACCAGHRPAAARSEPSCHAKPAASQCPMRAAGGEACPMHKDGHRDDTTQPTRPCTLRGTCAGPAAALLALLSSQGVLPDAIAVLADASLSADTVSPHERPLRRLTPPDPPPPRA